MNISTEKKIMDLENRLVAARGGEGGTGHHLFFLNKNKDELFSIYMFYNSY